MKKRLELNIFGLVQGVFFRGFPAEQAHKLNLTGWVKNEPEGTLHVLAEGEEEDLKKLADSCRQGPPMAQVRDTEENWQEPTGEFTEFEIIY